MFETYSIPSLQFHELIVAPSFGDFVPTDTAATYNGMLQEFTVMDDVVTKRPIIDIRGTQNILQRRDKSCDLIYKKVFGISSRQITVDELYAATNHCRHEFYKGALKDWRDGNDKFGELILPYFKKAVAADLATNSYFGDVTRVQGNSSKFSTDAFDGVVKAIKQYIALGVIPAAQTFTIPTVDMRANPTDAYNTLKTLVDKQNDYLRNEPDANKYIECDRAIVDGYARYLQATGNGDANTLAILQNGVKIYSIDGIAVLPINIWGPVLTEISGANAHMAILTVWGNLVFGTDKNYGEGEDGKTALEIWYEKKEMSFYYQMFLKAGTQVALPEHIVFGATA